MALNKNTNNCTSALLLLALVTFSQLMASQGRPLSTGSYITAVHDGRNLLSHGSDSVPKGMVEGTASPPSGIHGDKVSIVDADGVRPSTPGHSPSIGHAFIINKEDRGGVMALSAPVRAVARIGAAAALVGVHGGGEGQQEVHVSSSSKQRPGPSNGSNNPNNG